MSIYIFSQKNMSSMIWNFITNVQNVEFNNSNDQTLEHPANLITLALKFSNFVQWYSQKTVPYSYTARICRTTARKMNAVVCAIHDDVIKSTNFPRYWLFVRGIHWSPVNFPHNGQWRGALLFSLICAWVNWVNGGVNNRKAGGLKCHHNHYDVTVMIHHDSQQRLTDHFLIYHEYETINFENPCNVESPCRNVPYSNSTMTRKRP